MELEAHESGPIILCVHLGRNDLSVFLEEFFEGSIVHAWWKVLNEEVSVSLTLVFSISLFVVDQKFDLFIANLHSVKCLDSSFSFLLLLELDIAESSALTITEYFKFARFNVTRFSAELTEFFLVHIFGEISNEDVSLAVEIAILFLVENDMLLHNLSVVHGFEASCCFFFRVEIKVTESLGNLSIMVEHDFGTGELKTSVLEELVEIEVKASIGEIADVKTVQIRVVPPWLLLLKAHAILHLTSHCHWSESHHGHASWHHVEHTWSTSHHIIHLSLRIRLLSVLLLRTSSTGELRTSLFLAKTGSTSHLLSHEHLLLWGLCTWAAHVWLLLRKSLSLLDTWCHWLGGLWRTAWRQLLLLWWLWLLLIRVHFLMIKLSDLFRDNKWKGDYEYK